METKFSILHTLSLLVLMALCFPLSQASAGYTSIYVFGDGVCTTTQDPSPEPSNLYFGSRFCNGLVWVEVLSQTRGINYAPAKNVSKYKNYSNVMVTSVNNLAAPADAATSLFIVWCANADFVKFVSEDAIPPNNANLTVWQDAITQTVNNHVTAVSTLHQDKGARVIMLPTAADIMKVPFFNFYDYDNNPNTDDKAFIRARVGDFNNQLAAAMNSLVAANPGLTIVRPDVFTFLDQVLGNPVGFGMMNPFPDNTAIDLENPWTEGSDFVFWDDQHPTAKFQAALANFINNEIPPLDTVPPVITLPGNIVNAVTGAGGAVVNFTTSAVDLVDGPVATTAVPASGSVFPIGTTTVNVSASDAAGNPANGSFKVTVVNMNGLLRNVTITPAGAGLPAISGLIQGGPPSGSVILQASTDLGKSDPWRDLSTIMLDASGSQSFGPVLDPQGAGLKRDFFRIKLPLSP